MSISSDVQGQLEQFSQLDAFFDAVKNPDKYLKLISDAKDILKKTQELVGPANTVEKANGLLIDAKQKLAEASEKVNEMYDDFEKEQTKWSDTKLKIEEALVSDRGQIVRDGAALVKQKQDADAVDKRNQDLLDSITKREIAAKLKEDELAAHEAELQDKAAKLKQLLG